jgi:hypothetical protein
MWKCICGYVLRSVAHTCPQCDRTFLDNAPFTERLNNIELALSFVVHTGTEIAEIEQMALACLANDMSLLCIANQLENTSNPIANQLARILRNLVR